MQRPPFIRLHHFSNRPPDLFDGFKKNLFSLFIVHFAALALFLFSSKSYALPQLTGKLNINDATQKEFLLLPHIGIAKAEAIYNYREKQGSFATLDSLREIKGIGRKNYEDILPYIKLSGKSDLHLRDASGEGGKLPLGAQGNSRALLLGNSDFFKTLLDRIKSAEKSIHLSMFLFKSSAYESNRANIILDAIASAAERGVTVSVLLEMSNKKNDSVTEENRKSAEKLIKRGVTVNFDSPERTTHTKAVVIDSRYVFIGSHNLTHSALRYNNELSLLLDSEELAGETLKYMKGIN